jgi:hypothetical protein
VCQKCAVQIPPPHMLCSTPAPLLPADPVRAACAEPGQVRRRYRSSFKVITPFYDSSSFCQPPDCLQKIFRKAYSGICIFFCYVHLLQSIEGFMALDPISIKPVNVALVKFTALDIVALQIFYNAVMASLNTTIFEQKRSCTLEHGSV